MTGRCNKILKFLTIRYMQIPFEIGIVMKNIQPIAKIILLHN
jgi:hypothetical protein